jgi:hypothetical protein
LLSAFSSVLPGINKYVDFRIGGPGLSVGNRHKRVPRRANAANPS